VKIPAPAALACIVLTLMACGAGSPTPTIAKKAPPEPSLEPGGPAPTPPPLTLGTPAPTTPGGVTVTPAKAAFSVGDPVAATVGNGLDGAIYTEDQKTACSIVLLERWAVGAWEPLVGCGYEKAPAIVRIGPGEVVEVEIDPRSTHFENGRAPAFGEGTYRFRFAWRTEPEPEGHTSESVTSGEFRVGR